MPDVDLTDPDQLADDFEAFMLGEGLPLVPPDEWDPGDPEADQPPAAVDADQANRLLRRYATLEAARDGITEQAKAEATRLALWKAQRLGVVEREMAWVGRQVEAWLRANVATRGSAQTQNLPNGTAKLTKLRARVIELRDDAAERIAATELAALEPLVATSHTLVKAAATKVLRPAVVLDPQPPDVPAGYDACSAVVAIPTGELDSEGEPKLVDVEVPGVALLVPRPGAEGMSFSIKVAG